MIRAIFFDAGGVLFLNCGDRGVVNEDIVAFITSNSTKYIYGVLSSTDLPVENALDQFELTGYFKLVQTTGNIGIAKDNPDFQNSCLFTRYGHKRRC